MCFYLTVFAANATRRAFAWRVKVTNAHGFGTARATIAASSFLLAVAASASFAGQHGRRCGHAGTAVD